MAMAGRTPSISACSPMSCLAIKSDVLWCSRGLGGGVVSIGAVNGGSSMTHASLRSCEKWRVAAGTGRAMSSLPACARAGNGASCIFVVAGEGSKCGKEVSCAQFGGTRTAISESVAHGGFQCFPTKTAVRATLQENIVSETIYEFPTAPILLPEGPWKQISGGVTAPTGFKAAGLYAGLRAVGQKPDLALIIADEDAIAAGTFTKNLMAAAPVIYCKEVLKSSDTARAILINAGQANAATGDAGYQDVLDCADAIATQLGIDPKSVLIESTGVIGKRIKKEALLNSLEKLATSLSASEQGAESAAIAITTTDLVSKSVAIQTTVGSKQVKLGGIAKGSGMIHPNMATMLGVVTTDASVTVDVWRPMVLTAVSRSFNQITVDGDSSTNDTLLALASGNSGGPVIDDIYSEEAQQLQRALDAVLQGLAKSIAWDGEGATCLIEVNVSGADDETDAAKVAKSVAASSLTKAAVYGRDPNWGRIACAAGYSGAAFDPLQMRIKLGDYLLMDAGQPIPFDREGASSYLRATGEVHGTVTIDISIGQGYGTSSAWGCDLSYDYVKINAEYTT